MAHALAVRPPPQVHPAAQVVQAMGLLDAGQKNPIGHAAVHVAEADPVGHVRPLPHATHAVLHAAVLFTAQ